MTSERKPERLVVVGCGTVVPEPDRACSCYYLELGGIRALLDCGSGALQPLARLGLPWARLTHVLLSHFHVDHIGAVPGLIFALKYGVAPPRRGMPLEIWGPPGTKALFRRLAAVLGDWLLDPGFPLSVREIGPGETVGLGDVGLSAHKTPHTPESQAVRLESGGHSVTYTGDTGPEGDLAAFARGSRLLVCECSLPDDEVGDNHLSPGRVARLAVSADPERLLLTHVYPHLRLREDVRRLVHSAGYLGAVDIAHEGWTFDF